MIPGQRRKILLYAEFSLGQRRKLDEAPVSLRDPYALFVLHRKKEDCAPSESEKKEEDSPTAKDSIENEHKAPDVKGMVGKEHGSDHEQHEEKQETRVRFAVGN